MTTQPDQIRAQITELLADVPDVFEPGTVLADDHVDAVAERLEQAHDLLVRALESVEKG